MGGIQGVGGLNPLSPERPAEVRDRKKDDVKAQPAGDGVQFSSSSQEAAGAAKLVQASNGDSDVRSERVEAARASIDREDFKIPSLIAEVARRISKLI